MPLVEDEQRRRPGPLALLAYLASCSVPLLFLLKADTRHAGLVGNICLFLVLVGDIYYYPALAAAQMFFPRPSPHVIQFFCLGQSLLFGLALWLWERSRKPKKRGHCS